MAYQIDKFNGNFLVTIDDQTINTTATNLKLVGRNYAGYGEIQNENFVHLLENFASTTAPPRSLEGQVWYDASAKKLKYFDGQRYKLAAGAEVSAAAPAGLSSGEFWFNTAEQQLYTWNGLDFILIGPERAPTEGDTITRPRVVKDVLGNNKSILEFVVASKTIAIFSKDQFNINPISSPIEGFSIIRPGINLVDIDTTGSFTTTDFRLWGTSTNSERLNGFTSDDFLRSSNTIFRSQVRFLDSGFTVGDQNDLRITISNGNEPIIENAIGGNIIFRIRNAAVPRDVVILGEQGILPGSNEQYFLGRPGIRWKEVNSETVRAETFYGKFIGTIESPAPGSPGGPPIGQPAPPLALQSVQVAGSFSMAVEPNAVGAAVPDFSIELAGSTGSINLTSGTLGVLDNVDIGLMNPARAKFTSIDASEIINVSGNVQSNSTTSGTLKVIGGVGITGNLFVGGNTNFVGSGSLTVPVGRTEQRPPIPAIGMIRFNTDIDNFEGYDGVNWRAIGSESSDDYDTLDSVPTVELDYLFVNESADSVADYGNLF